MPKQKLQVRPLTRAYRPKYPSFADPNPLLYPETRPYPFSQKMIDRLCQAGFAGALLLSPFALNAQQTDSEPPSNPFPMEATNLPFVPIAFGTGQPSRVSQEHVVDLIYQVFIQEGLQPTRDTIVSGDGYTFTANAYDESCQIGFVWLNYANYGEGMQKADSWYPSPGVLLSFEEQKERVAQVLGSEYEHSYLHRKEQYVEGLVNKKYRNKDYDHALQADFRAQLPLFEGEAERAYFIERLAAHHFLFEQGAYQNTKQTAGYFDLLESMLQRIEDPLTRYTLLQRSNLIVLFLRAGSPELRALMENEIRQICSTDNPQQWQAAHEELVQFTSLDVRRKYIGRKPEVEQAFIAILAAKTQQDREEKRAVLVKMIDALEVSMPELQRIDEQATEGDAYIAPISQRDDRTAYRVSLTHSPEIEAQLTELARARSKSTDEAERAALQEQFDKLYQEQMLDWEKRHELGRMEALRRLEDDVRNYIRWARSQQGY